MVAELELQGGAFGLRHATVQSSSSISAGTGTSAYTASLSHVTFVLDNENSSGSAQAPALGSTLTASLTSPYYISYDMPADASVSGSLTLDFSCWATDIQDGSYDGILLTMGVQYGCF